MIGLFQTGSIETFQPIILIYRRGNFVYRHYGLYFNLSSIVLPLRSLIYISSYLISISLLCIYIESRVVILIQSTSFPYDTPPLRFSHTRHFLLCSYETTQWPLEASRGH